MTATHNLKPLEKLILDTVLGMSGKWVTRLDITRAIGRPNQAHPSDIEALTRLTELGLIEAKQEKRGLVGIKWVYRAK